MKCKYCQKEIVNKYGRSIYCSKDCSNKNKSILISKKNKQVLKEYIFNCKKCNKEYKLFLSIGKYKRNKYIKYCSLSCRNSRIRTEKIKELISKGRNKIKYDDKERTNYSKFIHKKIIKEIYNKYNGICQLCNKSLERKVGKYIGHHIDILLTKKDKKEYLETKNRILLCSKCHIYVHKQFKELQKYFANGVREVEHQSVKL